MKKHFMMLAFLAATGAGAVAAPEPKQNCAISVDADKVVGNEKSNTGDLSGNVVVTSCDMKLHADMIHVAYVANQPDKITATGHVVVVSQKGGIASGDTGIYDVPKKLVTLTGRVVLKQGQNVLSGTHGTYNLATGIAQVDAGNPNGTQAGTTTNGGRVHAILTPSPGKGN